MGFKINFLIPKIQTRLTFSIRASKCDPASLRPIGSLLEPHVSQLELGLGGKAEGCENEKRISLAEHIASENLSRCRNGKITALFHIRGGLKPETWRPICQLGYPLNRNRGGAEPDANYAICLPPSLPANHRDGCAVHVRRPAGRGGAVLALTAAAAAAAASSLSLERLIDLRSSFQPQTSSFQVDRMSHRPMVGAACLMPCLPRWAVARDDANRSGARCGGGGGGGGAGPLIERFTTAPLPPSLPIDT